MKLKLDDKGNAVVKDGKPIYVQDNGTEVEFDYPATLQTIARLNAEAKDHRLAKEAAETKLQAFAAITDPAAAVKALATVKNLDDKRLVDAGEVERVKQEVIKATEAKYEPMVKERDSLKGQLHAELIGGRFVRSKFIAEKLAIPADLVQARFGAQFKLEGNNVIAYDGAGNKVFSAAKPGEVADFDEALEIIVNQYPQRDHILKGRNGSGGGAQGGGSGSGGKPTKTRAEFALLDPAGQAAFVKSGTIVD